MASRIVVFGATGYTGRLVAERLVEAGARPVLAGRNEERLAALAGELGGLEYARADALRQNSVFDLVDAGDVLVSTVGPFAKWGGPAVRAAASAGAVYLDSTGEPEFIRQVFDELDAPARRSGAALLPAMGFDFVPGTLAGALALEAAGAGATRVDVGYYSLGGMVGALSGGTRTSLVGVTLAGGHAYRDGRVQTVRNAERVRSFQVAGRSHEAISVGGSEHYALPAAYSGLREVNVYLGWFGPLSRPLQAGALVGEYVTKLPLARATMRFWGERLMDLVPDPSPGTTPGGSSWIVAEAFDARGARVSSVQLTGVDGYEFTGRFIAWAAQQRIEGTGALGAVQAFGLESLEAGCRAAGLERVT
jgi:short subunit dehydrogenase-like uncharacterized protein